MKKQPYPVMDLTGGLSVSKDPLFIADKEHPSLWNTRIDKGMIRKDLGKRVFSDDLPLDGSVVFIDTFRLMTGTSYLLVVTTKWVYLYNVAADTFTVKNPSFAVTADVVFAATGKTITHAGGGFTAAGFAEGDVVTTDATLNPGPFTIHGTPSDTVITVHETLVDETVTKTITGQHPFTGDEDYPFCSAATFDDGTHGSITDIYFLTNGKDKIMTWHGTGNFVWLTGVPAGTYLYCKRLASFKNRLILGFTTQSGYDCPRRIAWSALADPEDFSSTGYGFIDLTDSTDWVVAIVPFKDRFFIFKEHSIWELAYVGGTTYFNVILKEGGVGTLAPNSVVSLGDKIIFLGTDNIYTYNGLSLTPIGDQLFSLFFAPETKIVNTTKLARCSAIYIEETSEYWLSTPTEGEQPDVMFKYNVMFGSWSRKQQVLTALGPFQVAAQDLWSDLVGTWAAQDWIWMERALPAGSPTVLIGDPDGNVWEDDKITPSTDYMCMETKDWMFAHAERWVEVHVEAKGGMFTLCYSLDQGLTWSNSVSCTADASSFKTYIMYVNVTSNCLRCKIESYANDLIIKYIEPWYIPRKRVQGGVTAS